AAAGGQHQDRNVLAGLAQFARGLKAAFAGQHDGERHGVVPLRASRQHLERGLAVRRHLALVTLGLEGGLQSFCQMLLVFNGQTKAQRRALSARCRPLTLPAPFWMRGSAMVKTLHIRSAARSAKVLPPCLLTMERTMKSPSPAPLTRVATRR